jgi:hypothetical protein
MKVTRIAYSKKLTASKLKEVKEIARRLGILRSEIWNEFGSIKGVGLRDREIRNNWLSEKKTFDVQGKLWKETLRDTFDDICACREASKIHVRRDIYKRTDNECERKRLLTILKSDNWKKDGYLCRKMRRHYVRGHTNVRNQILLNTGCYKTFIRNNRAWVKIMSLIPGKRISIPLNTSFEPIGTLRLIIKNDIIEIHYLVDAKKNCSVRPCGELIVGVDKGYTEALTDSDGLKYGDGLGDLLNKESDFVKIKYQRRNKIHNVAKLNPSKSIKIKKNNLGRKKLDKRSGIHEKNVKNVISKAVHKVVDKSKKIVSEDLTFNCPSNKKYSKNTKRKLSGWTKGVLSDTLKSVSQRRSASLVLVNAAYTSQIDSRYGILLGDRIRDLFHCFDGVVLDADHNAAQNILTRFKDKEICLLTTPREVRSILLKRTEKWCDNIPPETVGTAQPRL